MAQEANREIFAVPGSPIDPRARGSNDLLRQGAPLTEALADILANLPDHPGRQGLGRDPLFARPHDLSEPPPSPFEDAMWGLDADPAELARARDQILEFLGPAPSSVDDLIRRCQFSAASVMAVLLEFELGGRIETLPGNRVALLSG